MRLLDLIRQNAAADWYISDVEAVCRQCGLRCSPPSGGGSHYKVSHPAAREILTIPNRRPIKPVYNSQAGEADRQPGTQAMTERDFPVVIAPLSEAEGGGYLATVPDLPGCMSDGATREEAARNIGDAIAQWIAEAGKLGREIPVPRTAIPAE